tara:strand:+ start:108 stop:917 length:810 start_codon:yes stop_codon:yes gene_type:complete
MKEKLPHIILVLMISTSLSGCMDANFSDTDSRTADLQQSLTEANYTIMLKDGEIEVLSKAVSDQRALIEELDSRVNGSLEEDLQNLGDRYLDLKIFSHNSNQTIMALESRLNEEIALREQMQEEWNESEANELLRDMSNAYLRDAGLWGSDLSETDLSYANLIDANLNGADISSSDLSYADLEWAYVRYADLNGSDLSETYLYNTNMEGTGLMGANLNNAYTVGLRLIDANLLGADLSGIEWAGIYWGNTVCPDGSNSDDNGNTCENNT